MIGLSHILKGGKCLAMVVLALSAAGIQGARAERVIASVSNHRVTITANYAGQELVLFGSVERDDQTPPERKEYDVIVTVSGPTATMMTRRKARVAGIWINTDYREFLDVPTYLAVFSNRPIADITTPDIQRRQQLGLNNIILTQRIGTDYADAVADDPFRTAFLRLRGERGLYRESPMGVTMLTPTLFRASIPLPAEVQTGTYTVDIKVFSNGQLVTRAETAFEIVKVGFEQFVADAARQNGLAYGLFTMLMALLTGWFASVVFRKD
jgi:uncharacterized protein (TIGR02186 family)